jgi:hypothetical protein
MTKFVVVNKAPEKLEKGEIVISQPTFLDQIKQNSRKAPKQKLTAINHLREVLTSIAEKYDHDMNVFKFRLVNYVGRPFNSDADLSNALTEILRNEYPVIFDKYLEHELKNRPMSTRLIYYVGNFNSTGPFYKAGIDMIEEKDVESYLTGKPKKTVGKPAVTKEEAAANNGTTTES